MIKRLLDMIAHNKSMYLQAEGLGVSYDQLNQATESAVLLLKAGMTPSEIRQIATSYAMGDLK